MDWIQELAERKIQEAMERGEFDRLALRGKPLRLEDLSRVPEDLRVGFIVLKNAGVLPPEMELRKEMLTLRDLIDACLDPAEKRTLRQRLYRKMLRYHLLMGK